MRNRGVETRYAQALLAASRRAGDVDGVAESYAALVLALADAPRLREALAGPLVDQAGKTDLIRKVFGGRIEDTLVHFLLLLTEKGRFADVDGIQSEFQALVEKERGLARAHVTTAVPLADDLEHDLTAKLAAMTGATVVLTKTVDPSVLGGVRVTMGDRVIDGTVKTGLAKLRTNLMGTDVR